MELWDHQKVAIERASDKDCFALFFEPGTGKTRTSLVILEEKFKRHGMMNTLVLAPIVVLEQWKRELLKYSSIRDNVICVMSGTGTRKFCVFNRHKELHKKFIAITNYESLYNKAIQLALENWAEVLICDESSRVKEGSAQRTKNTLKISENCKYRYILSGTPILSSPLDIFSQFRILDHGETFGKNYFVFRATYFQDKNSIFRSKSGYFPNWVPKADCNEAISKKIAPLSMSITKDEALDLPELVREKIYVEMGKDQERAYKSMRDVFIASLNDKTSVAQLAITKTLRLQQIVSGFIKFDDDTEKEFDECPKLDALKEILEDIAPFHKVIVWAIFKRNYKQVRDLCTKLKLGYAELHGEISNKDDQVRIFTEDPNCRVMIGHPGSGGIGISLTVASYSIFFSRGFALEFDVQAESRNHRGGSLEAGHKKITRIDLLAKDTIDELILQAIEMKLQTSEEILGFVRGKL